MSKPSARSAQSPYCPSTRWPTSAPGRSRVVPCAGLVWTVSNARDVSQPFEAQVTESLHILSVQVLLMDIPMRGDFDRLWQAWIGRDPAHWPRRACFQAGLAQGLLVELVVVAASASASQRVRAP